MLDIDIVKYFDSIPHSDLRDFLDRRVMPNSIATMRRRPIATLVKTLLRCPCCSVPAQFRRCRSVIPIDADQCGVGEVSAPLDAFLISVFSPRSSTCEAVPVVNRRDPRATRSAPWADAAARAGGSC